MINGILQIVLYLGVLLALAKPMGVYMQRIYDGNLPVFVRWLQPAENFFYRLCGVDSKQEMRWTRYAMAALWFSLLGVLVVYALQRLQGMLPLNPQGFGAVTPDSSFNTALSFVTNTNWQGYVGETTMSYLTQMAGLTVQNFFSAATGMAVVIALIRGFARHTAETIGNFWVDMTRSTLYILLPISIVLALVLVGQGVVQNFAPYEKATLTESLSYEQPKLDDVRQPGQGCRGQRRHREDRGERAEPSPWARSLRRKRSRNSAPTAAVSSTPTRRTRTRIPRRSPTSSRCWRSS